MQTHQNATTTNMSCCFIASKHQTTNEFLHENEQNLINLKLFGNFNIQVIIILKHYFWFQSALYCMSILMIVLLQKFPWLENFSFWREKNFKKSKKIVRIFSFAQTSPKLKMLIKCKSSLVSGIITFCKNYLISFLLFIITA